VEGEKVSHNF